MTLHRTLHTVLYLVLTSLSFGQTKYRATYHGEGFQQYKKKVQTVFKDSISAINYLNEHQGYLIKKGYLLASIDSIKFKKTNIDVFTHLGARFEKAILSLDATELNFIKKHTPLNEKLISKTPFRPSEINKLMESISSCYLNNGYPFAKLAIGETTYQGANFTGEILIQKGPLFKWNNIVIKGDSSISTKYISNAIGIKKGENYSEKAIIDVSRDIEQIPFIEELRAHELLFSEDGVDLYLYLKSIPISSVNGVIGFQPNPATEKLIITGDVNLKLQNVLRRGELLDIRWQSIRDQTQSLNSKLNYPFLFNSPFGIDLSFDLYKRDTTFLELNSVIGIQYHLNNGSFIEGFYENISSSVLSGGENNPSFNHLSNVKNHMYGIAYSSQKVDYLPNPRSGYRIYFETSFGNRNSQINDTSSIVKTFTAKGQLNLEYYIPLSKRNVIRVSNRTLFYSAEDIFENELFRFGGLNSQRGFDEDELLATTKNTSTLEYRFLLDKNSHVFAFGDLTWYENNAFNYQNDTPFGLGVGFSFSTNLGVFSISYALGTQQNNPIEFRDSKIHFGYIAYF